jgi:dTDP-4-dehydrorhamnose reductase
MAARPEVVIMEKREQSESDSLEMWAGLECTVNRVNDEYLDQMECNGHATRVEDIARFSDLGIKKIRYPILWERVAPNGLENADWSWADERLKYLQLFEIQPIVGLVHHGSGPLHTSLVKPCFVEGLTEYARAVALRYPWVMYYTPVNEPLTTARFSGLYGHWYPHGKDGATFARALLNQCRATAECMRVIREVNPAARLVLTEDLGKTYSTPLLAYQAALENERRWLSMDLLTGKLTPEKPMWHYLRSFGVEEADMQWFLDHPCPPDILGINHYPTSERYLDERRELYPKWSHGQNEYHTYADVDAIRVRTQAKGDFYVGHYTLLKETWERYGLPMAVTEVHLHGPREQQLAWLQQVWNAAMRLRAEGVEVRAVTAWSLLGTYDWINLVTRKEGHYEPGVFDVRGPSPRPTAIAGLVRQLAKGIVSPHPLHEVPVWWQRSDRFLYPLSTDSLSGLNQSSLSPIAAKVRSSRITQTTELQESTAIPSNLRPLLIIGENTNLGQAFARICQERFLPFRSLNSQELDANFPKNIENLLDEIKPWAVVNATIYAHPVSDEEYDFSWWPNSYVPALVAAACQERNIAFATYSSDWVFDGLKGSPYLESDPLAPLNEYGRMQAQLEKKVMQANPSALAIRTGSLFDSGIVNDSLTAALRQLAGDSPLAISNTKVFSSAYLPDLVHSTLDLLVDGERGVWHLVNSGATTWLELVGRIARTMGMDTGLLHDSSGVNSGWKQSRYSVLESERGIVLPTLEDALSRYCREVKI